MRDRTHWRRNPTRRLRDRWSNDLPLTPGEALDVELGLYLVDSTVPGHTAADTWTLMGGYSYTDVFSPGLGDEARLRIRRSRYLLPAFRRPREWQLRLADYLALPVELRGFDLESPEHRPRRKEVSWVSDRFEHFERALTSPPPFTRRELPVAGHGRHRFSVHGGTETVSFDESLLAAVGADEGVAGHDLDAPLPGGGRPLTVTREELRSAARRMDELEVQDAATSLSNWTKRLERVELLLRDESEGRFCEREEFTIQGLYHLVGMVGAGKSTLRDILTFLVVVDRGLRVTMVVPDVAETLHTVNRLIRLGVDAAPVLGHTTRDKHLGRLHRRVAASGTGGSLLDHDDPAFQYLSTACPVDALRGLDFDRPLDTGQAPCRDLIPITVASAAADPLAGNGDDQRDQREPQDSQGAGEPGNKGERGEPGAESAARGSSGTGEGKHSCPLWRACPRHHASRALVTASVWVTTAAGLVHSGTPAQTGPEQLRYLELACRRSDLVIVDEADQVQLRLDNAFAPSATLIGNRNDSWVDEITRHKVAEIAGLRGRLLLARRPVNDWISASDTVTTATNRCYALLVSDADLRTWITQDYFSALTLHEWLISNWFHDVVGRSDDHEPRAKPDPERKAHLERVSDILNRFRDEPLQEQESLGEDDTLTPWVNRIVRLTLELLHPDSASAARSRLKSLLAELLADASGNIPENVGEIDTHLVRFEFTLLLAALHHRLNGMTTLWPSVEAALNLHGTSNTIARRPPQDYEPIVPESPMGNVLGFQFKQEEQVHPDGGRSGELRYFRCGGVGRELLTALPHLPEVDDRPGPNVLLMSGTSWAGTSTRYHIHTPVHAILRPHRDEVEAIEQTRFEKLILTKPNTHFALRLSGNNSQQGRDEALEQMLYQLAVPDRTAPDPSSMLQDELDDLPEGRKRLLLLVGSYDHARKAWEYLNKVPEWRGRVTRLVSDDTDLDDTWATLRRGDVARFPQEQGEVLVAPLLAVERGHNIVQPDGRAAIGTVYFLNRPHPRPDDISLAVQSIHDWAVRRLRGTGRERKEFLDWARDQGSPDQAGRRFRTQARSQWTWLLKRRVSWTSLKPEEKTAFTWDQLVVIWQVIGRLVRGGVPARAVFVDSAFFPEEAQGRTDTHRSGLLVAMRKVLHDYLADDSAEADIDRSLVEALYGPLYRALDELET